MEEKFKIGDIVQLKSGGPKMTVHELGRSMRVQNVGGNYNGKVKCGWFNGSETNWETFHQDALEIFK